MAGNKHATAFSMENDATAAFATGRKVNPLELLTKTLGEATSRPDVRPGEQGRGGAPSLVVTKSEELKAPEAPQAVAPQAEAPAPVNPAQPPAPQPQQIARDHQSEIVDDGASYGLPSAATRDEVNRGGRPRHGAERKVERTISMDKSLDKILLNLAIIESVRLGRRVSSAEVAVRLMRHGLSNMKDNQVLPGDDGGGLEVAPEDLISVTLPKIGGTAT